MFDLISENSPHEAQKEKTTLLLLTYSLSKVSNYNESVILYRLTRIISMIQYPYCLKPIDHQNSPVSEDASPSRNLPWT